MGRYDEIVLLAGGTVPTESISGDTTISGGGTYFVSGTTTVTLESAAIVGSGTVVTIINNGAGTVTIDPDVASPNTSTIEGSTANITLTQYQTRTLISDGTEWIIIASTS
jgi:hypothetical protein